MNSLLFLCLFFLLLFGNNWKGKKIFRTLIVTSKMFFPILTLSPSRFIWGILWYFSCEKAATYCLLPEPSTDTEFCHNTPSKYDLRQISYFFRPLGCFFISFVSVIVDSTFCKFFQIFKFIISKRQVFS